MPRSKKDYTPINIRVSTPVFERLEKYCEEAGQSKTIAVERALSMYIDDYEKKMKILNQALGKM